MIGPLVYVAVVGHEHYSSPETMRGRKCGKCLRGVFRGVLYMPGICRVCGAEHWVGVENSTWMDEDRSGVP